MNAKRRGLGRYRADSLAGTIEILPDHLVLRLTLPQIEPMRNAVVWMCLGSWKAATTFNPAFRLGKEGELAFLDRIDRMMGEAHIQLRKPRGFPLSIKTPIMIGLTQEELVLGYAAMLWCRDVNRLGDSMCTYLGVDPEELDETVALVATQHPVIVEIAQPIDPRKPKID